MQPRTGSWTFDDHTTSTWVQANVGMPSPNSGLGDSAATQPEPARDESAVWDDPEEATRRLSSHDLARTLNSATDLDMDWDDDDSATNTYNPSHARSFIQMSQAAAQQAAAPRRVDPATSGALASLPPLADPDDARTRRAAAKASSATRTARSQPSRTRTLLHAPMPPTASKATKAKPTFRVAPKPVAKPEPQREVRRAAPPTLKPAPVLGPMPQRALYPEPMSAHDAAPQPSPAHADHEVSRPNAAAEPRTRPLWAAGAVSAMPAPPPPMAAHRRAPTMPPGVLNVAPPHAHEVYEDHDAHAAYEAHAEHDAQPQAYQDYQAYEAPQAYAPPPEPPAYASASEHVWEQTWEEAQELARNNLQMYAEPAPVQAPVPPRRTLAMPMQVEGPTHRNYPPAQQQHYPTLQQHYQVAAYDGPNLDSAVLPPMAAVRELRAAQPTLAPLPLPLESAYEDFKPRGNELSRLVLRSILPGAALFAAVLFGRVLLSGPVPAPQPPAPVVTPVEVAPTVEPAPPQPAAAATPAVPAAPAPAERRSSRSRDGSSSRARSQDTSSREDAPVESTRSSRSRAASAASEDAPVEPTRSRSHASSASSEDAPAARATSAESAAPAPEPTSGIGILRVNSRPWSQVSVDGKLVGNTPQMGLRLRAGTHTVELTNPELGMSKKFKVEVKADDIVTRSEMLEE